MNPLPSTRRGGRFARAFALLLALALRTPLPHATAAAPAPAPKPAAAPATASGPLTDAERKAIRAELQPLQERLAALRHAPNLKPQHWADAQIFLKGVVWALDFGPVTDAKSREWVAKGILRARQRSDALAAGQHPWADKRGRTVRGFISAIDDSVQPYGLVVPAGHDPAQPTRLDVVLHNSRGATGRYVVLNSGHTYHDAELRFSYMVFPRLGDWAIFKVGDNPATAPAPLVAETVLHSGFFDEAWQARASH